MTTLMLVAYQYPYKFILGPALIIVLAVIMALLVKYPSSKKKIGGVLVLVGICETLATLPIAFLWGFFIGIATIIVGIIIFAFKIPGQSTSLFRRKSQLLRKIIYLILALIIALSALIITIRATTSPIIIRLYDAILAISS